MFDFLKKIAPKSLKDKIYLKFKNEMRARNAEVSSKIPKYPINATTIKNTKVLLNREEMLKLLPKNGTVAELGVDKGDFSEAILKLNKPKTLILVDLWGNQRYNDVKRRAVEEKFSTEINNGQLQIEIGYSTEVAERFEDHHFDWIYIDTDHTYQVTIDELEAWKAKVKPDGIIAGHDYILGNWNKMIRYGVIEAVYEFCNKYNWEIVYLTMEHDNNPSFAIRKIID